MDVRVLIARAASSPTQKYGGQSFRWTPHLTMPPFFTDLAPNLVDPFTQNLHPLLSACTTRKSEGSTKTYTSLFLAPIMPWIISLNAFCVAFKVGDLFLVLLVALNRQILFLILLFYPPTIGSTQRSSKSLPYPGPFDFTPTPCFGLGFFQVQKTEITSSG